LGRDLVQTREPLEDRVPLTVSERRPRGPVEVHDDGRHEVRGAGGFEEGSHPVSGTERRRVLDAVVQDHGQEASNEL
jgi:hypothetical protein